MVASCCIVVSSSDTLVSFGFAPFSCCVKSVKLVTNSELSDIHCIQNWCSQVGALSRQAVTP